MVKGITYKQWKYPGFKEIKVFVFSVEGFWFFKFHEKVAKPDKGNFRRDVTVAFEFKNW